MLSGGRPCPGSSCDVPRPGKTRGIPPRARPRRVARSLAKTSSDFREKRCCKRKRKTKARAEKEEETATTSTVEHKSVCRKRNVELPTGKAAKKAKITDFFQ
eukprot:Stramenopile-MAST_4_protein_3402